MTEHEKITKEPEASEPPASSPPPLEQLAQIHAELLLLSSRVAPLLQQLPHRKSHQSVLYFLDGLLQALAKTANEQMPSTRR